MARRVFDYVLLGLVPSAEDMALTQQGKSGPITGKQRPANDYVLPGSPAAAAAVSAPPPPAVRVAERVR